VTIFERIEQKLSVLMLKIEFRLEARKFLKTQKLVRQLEVEVRALSTYKMFYEENSILQQLFDLHASQEKAYSELRTRWHLVKVMQS